MLSSLALRVEKRMIGRAVTTDLGKKLLKEYVQVSRQGSPSSQAAQQPSSQAAKQPKQPSSQAAKRPLTLPLPFPSLQDETFIILQAMRGLASLDPRNPPKYGAKVEETILKTAVKVVLLYQHQRINARDFDAGAHRHGTGEY